MSTVLVRIPHSEGGAHDDDEPLPASRFAEPSSNPDDPDLATVVRRIRSAKRIVVVCGAGGEAIGTVMERDLRGTGPRGEREGRADLLLVAGTSLSIPGVKRMVKEMAKSLSRSAQPVKAVYVNAEPPSKPTEWDGVFDVWAQGDVQDLAALVEDTSFAPPLPKTPRRKKDNGLPTPSTGSRKRKAEDDDTPTKRTMLLTPASTPQKSRSSSLPSPSPLASPSPPPRPVFVAEEPKPTCVAKVQAAKGSRKVTQKKDTRKRRKHSPSPSLSPEPEVTPTKPVARFSPPPPLSFDMTCLVEPNNVRCLDDRR
ncbi:uncharacterized protein CcaverHIS019_0212800 [Cutaneotrichosporon cavernicola]|uniref:Deacetylase sirtuin-type domain-containing protein n=1 Tax=Cutaneotrichosporon cavernicola TaxID=279322 RepID=A0AA48L2P8_9TREE|nr:uncharacterized protein CcaverHIS019_0212800 [Cutaneotrichosporon cavernicola]BEI89918.1 hypothetical protein CcaverHIS019_0212800 [Cutaneotrichosporon cavernicola]BEI97689.1 hypothetical protein CcaverHIS631_0212780 [Cutaneotrichosporon cavernicola]BEJ05466.1 hypothetical protein CcaverHIS641_0212830 [Cutaneotrichosporon cavernicola]